MFLRYHLSQVWVGHSHCLPVLLSKKSSKAWGHRHCSKWLHRRAEKQERGTTSKSKGHLSGRAGSCQPEILRGIWKQQGVCFFFFGNRLLFYSKSLLQNAINSTLGSVLPTGEQQGWWGGINLLYEGQAQKVNSQRNSQKLMHSLVGRIWQGLFTWSKKNKALCFLYLRAASCQVITQKKKRGTSHAHSSVLQSPAQSLVVSKTFILNKNEVF